MSKNCNCSWLALVASILIGIVTGILRYTAVITVTPAFLWVVFGIAVVYLAVSFFVSALGNYPRYKHCRFGGLRYFLLGILGTILTSVILLAVDFAATSVLGAILSGALLFFFSLIITEVACLVKAQAEGSESVNT